MHVVPDDAVRFQCPGAGPAHQHLDLESITAVNNGLIDFKGVVLFASHDHEFVQTIANRVMEFVDGKLIDKMCTYDAYIAGAREEMLARLNG